MSIRKFMQGLNTSSNARHVYAWGNAAITAVCVVVLLFPQQFPQWASFVGWGILLVLHVSGRLLYQQQSLNPLILIVYLITALALLSLVVSFDPANTLIHVNKYIAGFGVFWAAFFFMREVKFTPLYAISLLCAILVITVFMTFTTYWDGISSPNPIAAIAIRIVGSQNPFDRLPDLGGYNTNITAGILALLVPFSVAFLRFKTAWTVRVFAIITLMTSTLIVLAAQSSGAIAAIVIGCVVMLILSTKRPELWVGIAALSIVMGVVVVLAFGYEDNVVSVLMADNNHDSLAGRIELWNRGLSIIHDFAWTGVGLGQVQPLIILMYPTQIVSDTREYGHIHSIFLQAGAEMGVPGLILEVALVVAVFCLAFRASKRLRGTDLQALAYGCLGMIIVYLVHGFTDAVAYSPYVHTLSWAIFGVASALSVRAISESRLIESA